MNNYVEIDSIQDIDTAIDLIIESAKNNASCPLYMGGIIMPLPENKQFTDTLYIRNLKTRLMESHEVTIIHAYCGVSLSIESDGTYLITCAALNETEGYYTTKESSLGEGYFIAATNDLYVFRNALIRFFGSEDFTNHCPDALTRTVMPNETLIR